MKTHFQYLFFISSDFFKSYHSTLMWTWKCNAYYEQLIMAADINSPSPTLSVLFSQLKKQQQQQPPPKNLTSRPKQTHKQTKPQTPSKKTLKTNKPPKTAPNHPLKQTNKKTPSQNRVILWLVRDCGEIEFTSLAKYMCTETSHKCIVQAVQMIRVCGSRGVLPVLPV